MSVVKKRLSDDRLLVRTFFHLLPFQMLMVAISSINSIVDSLYASNAIGESAMGAIGLFAPLSHFLYAAGIVLLSGAQILYGRRIARDHDSVQSVFSVNLVVALVISLLMTGGMVLMAVLGSAPDPNGKKPEQFMLNDYLLGQAIGIVPLILGQQLFGFLSLENQTKRTMAASISCFVFNAIMDHVLIVFFKMGIFGLGLASAISNWIFFAIQAAYFIAARSEWKLSFRGCKWRDALQMFILGYPSALSRFAEMFRCVIVNYLLLTHVGAVGISAFAASNALLAIVWAYPFGMMAVSRMILSISYGEEDRRSMVDTMRIVYTRGMVLMFLITSALCLLAVPLTHLYYHDPADPVFNMTVMGFRLLPWCMPPAVISLIFASYAQVTQKKIFSFVLPVVDGVVGVVLFSFLLIPRLGINGLYIANILNGLLCCALIIIQAWMSRKRFPRTVEDLMAMPDSFGLPEDQRLDLTVRSSEEVIQVSRRIMAFLKERNYDPRKTYFAGLCLEEMAGNVVEHGFPKDRKRHSVDIRVSCGRDGLIMRIRDDCVAFNPAEHARVMEPEDGIKDFGIRLVYSLADSVEYRHLLNHNVLTMRF